jgi:predicted ATPase
MKINKDNIQISDKETVSWEEVKTLKSHDSELYLVLTSGKVLKVPAERPTTIDAAFRAYESYVKDHPHHKKKRRAK